MSGIVFIRDLAVVMVVAGAVGWLCQRIGLSVVVGYLLAGMVIGPYTPPFQLVEDQNRVQLLAQVGLIFLIFSIGLGLSFERLKRLGLSVVAATVISSILIFNGCRLLGLALGWSSTESLFLAGMLMVSSSAIISKVLEEINATHQRAGQMALGVTVLEDVVAVVMLTLLTSLIQFGDTRSAPILPTLGALSAFVVFLVFLSLLLVPRILGRLTHSDSGELRTILIAGLLLSLAWLADRAGYSLALGSFVLGAIVAGTRQKREIERVFDGVRQMFGAVFFVAMGMLLDVRLLAENWALVLLISAVSLLGRTLACTIGLIAVGNSSKESLRAGLALNPIGEFSFIIAQMGVLAKVVPERLYPLAVGVSLITSLVAPILMRHAPALGQWVERRQPLFLREWILFYHDWLTQLRGRQKTSLIWRLTGKRLVQTAAQVLFVSALLLFANPVYARATAWLGEDWLFPNGLKIVFWTIFGTFLLAPLIAIWRNLEALAMIFADGATSGHKRKKYLRPLVEKALKTVATVVLAGWLLALLPFGRSVWGVLAVVIAILAVLGGVFWRRLVYWHSRLEIELMSQIKSAAHAGASAGLAQALSDRPGDWDLQIDEVALPDHSEYAGKTIQELALRKRLGCSIVGIDRHGFSIANPAADTTLYPGDRLFLLGSAEQLAQAEQFFSLRRQAPETLPNFDELCIESVAVPPGSLRAGKMLVELDMIRQLGVQIGGIHRRGQRLPIPRGTDQLAEGDELLVLGTPNQIQEFRAWLEPAPDRAAAEASSSPGNRPPNREPQEAGEQDA